MTAPTARVRTQTERLLDTAVRSHAWLLPQGPRGVVRTSMAGEALVIRPGCPGSRDMRWRAERRRAAVLPAIRGPASRLAVPARGRHGRPGGHGIVRRPRGGVVAAPEHQGTPSTSGCLLEDLDPRLLECLGAGRSPTQRHFCAGPPRRRTWYRLGALGVPVADGLASVPVQDRRTARDVPGQTMQESPSQDGPPPIVARACSVHACSSAARSTSCG